MTGKKRGSLRPGLLPARTRHDARRGRGQLSTQPEARVGGVSQGAVQWEAAGGPTRGGEGPPLPRPLAAQLARSLAVFS